MKFDEVDEFVDKLFKSRGTTITERVSVVRPDGTVQVVPSVEGYCPSCAEWRKVAVLGQERQCTHCGEVWQER